jgi:hypothetical protein
MATRVAARVRAAGAALRAPEGATAATPYVTALSTKKPPSWRRLSCWNSADGQLNVERAMGIEPTALAWEARVLPLYDARRARYFTRNWVI